MNSSGIKRGLAVSAISALAVAGIPALATSASADPGDVIQVAFTGPALDGGAVGAEIVLKTKGIADLAEAQANLEIVNTALTDTANTPNQTIGDITVVEFRPDAATNEFGGDDDFDEIVVRVPVDVRNTGDAANFAIFLDDNNAGANNDTVQADEASAPVTVQTAGRLAQIDVTPASQTAAANVLSGPYTVTLKDAAGRTTQLGAGETITINPDGATTTETADNSGAGELANVITASEIARGTDTFRASGPTVDVYDITLTSSAAPVVVGRATLDVVRSASITAPDEVDIVTAADDWNGFGNPNDPSPASQTFVRVDQSSIQINIRSTDPDADRNGTVTLNLTGTGITFGGRPTTTVSTVLDANGIGSLTITPDAGTVQVNDSIAISGAFAQTLTFVRGGEAAAMQPGAQAYVSAIDGSVDVTVTVVDRFGQPVSTGEVEARRSGGPNPDTDATAQRKAVGADGTVTFTFTDVNAVPGQSDTVSFLYFEDQFDNSGVNFGGASTQIRYTVDGQGRDFATRLEGRTAAGTGYNPATNLVAPLSDTEVNDSVNGSATVNESIALEVVGAEPNSRVTISVDNGALILRTGETRLAQGSASESVVLDGTGNLPSGWSIIGTKSGLVTVTVSAANRTETSQFTVAPQAYASQARNVTVSGPAKAVTGDQQVTYIAVVTDAFGNPVAGVTRDALNIQVSGPGQFQDSDVATNASGQIALNVRLDDNAQGVVTITVAGIPGRGQFGAQVDRETAASTSDDATGLPVSSNSATASTTVEIDDDTTPDPVKPVAVAKGSNRNTDGFDRVRVDVTPVDQTAGAAVELWKINAQGKARRVKTKALTNNGSVTWIRPDSNGKKVSRYFAKVRPTEASLATRSNTVRIK